jgi:hypothetical protein
MTVSSSVRHRDNCLRLASRPTGGLLVSLALALLTACSGTSSSVNQPPLAPGATETASPPTATPTEPVPPTPLGYSPADPDKIGHWVVVLPHAPTSAKQKSALAGWANFRQVSAQAINQRTVDFKILNSVTTGNARDGLLRAIGKRVKAGQFTVGETRIQIRSVRVDKGTSTIEICQDDQSYEVDVHGRTSIPAPGVALMRDKLLLVGGKWLVSDRPVYVPNGCAMQVTS